MLASTKEDRRSWDLRLVQWLGRSRGPEYYEQRKNRSPQLYAYFAVVYCALGIVEGDAAWIAVAAAAALISALMFYRARAKPRGAGPDR
jgi:hypothetical protein